jgi:hypothetical protein
MMTIIIIQLLLFDSLFVYLRGVLNGRWPITTSAGIQTPLPEGKHKDKTKKN